MWWRIHIYLWLGSLPGCDRQEKPNKGRRGVRREQDVSRASAVQWSDLIQTGNIQQTSQTSKLLSQGLYLVERSGSTACRLEDHHSTSLQVCHHYGRGQPGPGDRTRSYLGYMDIVQWGQDRNKQIMVSRERPLWGVSSQQPPATFYLLPASHFSQAKSN